MRCKKFKRLLVNGLKAIAFVALIALPVHAVTTTSWVHPCEDENDLVCNGTCPFCYNCRCEGSFDNDGHWTLGQPDGDITIIQHSHADVNTEEYIDMAFTAETIHELRVITDDTGGDDELDVLFNGNATVTVNNNVLLDATNGKVTLRVDGGGSIVTQ